MSPNKEVPSLAVAAVAAGAAAFFAGPASFPAIAAAEVGFPRRAD